MNLQSLIVVALRLMALNFVLRVVVHLTPTLFLGSGSCGTATTRGFTG
ncbi:MAG: hypothetical protein AB1705_12660 [Verrucomicrobiota bacterium]